MKLPYIKQPKKYAYRELIFKINTEDAQVALDAEEDLVTHQTIQEIAPNGYRVRRIFLQMNEVAAYDTIFPIFRCIQSGESWIGSLIGILHASEGGIDIEENVQGNGISSKKTFLLEGGVYTVKIGIEYVPSIDERWGEGGA